MKDTSYIRAFPKDAVKKDKIASKNKLLWAGSVIILVLAAVSFVFIPSMGRAGGSSGIEPFGYYNKKPIEFSANSFFTRMIEQNQDQLRREGRQGDDALYEIFDRSFKAAVLNEAFTYAVGKSGYVVPENAVDRVMVPYFYDENGKYSPRVFNNTSEAKKTELRKLLTEQLIYQRYYEDIFGASSDTLYGKPLYGIKTSEKETGFLGTLGNKERSFELAAFNVLSYPEAEAIQFAEAHSDLFTKYDFSVVTLNTEDEAKNTLRRINGNEVLFDDAVKDLSLKFYSGEDGKLTQPYQYALKTTVQGDDNFAALAALETGSLSGVIKTANSYSIFRCDGQSAPPDFSDDAVRTVARDYIRTYERGIMEDYFSNIANDFASEALQTGFDQACAEFNVSKIDVQSFPLNYGNSELFPITPSISQLRGAEKNEKFLQTAFSLNEGEISSPIVLGDNVLVLKLLSETTKEEDENTATYLVPYYSKTFDESAAQNAVLSDERLKNNFVTVFFKNYMSE